MKPKGKMPIPIDAEERKSIQPVICYPTDNLPKHDYAFYEKARKNMELVEYVIVNPRCGNTIEVPAGYIFKIVSIDGPQVGDLNIWNTNNLNEKFYSGKTRALHGTHVGVGDKLWSSFPYLRPMATIITDTLDWYGFDEDGGSVHDVIGTRCDPTVSVEEVELREVLLEGQTKLANLPLAVQRRVRRFTYTARASITRHCSQRAQAAL